MTPTEGSRAFIKLTAPARGKGNAEQQTFNKRRKVSWVNERTKTPMNNTRMTQDHFSLFIFYKVNGLVKSD